MTSSLKEKLNKFILENYEESINEKEFCFKKSSFDILESGFLDLTGSCEEEFITESSFSEELFRIIDEKKLKDSDVYNKVNISRQTFSKIRSSNDYHPNKSTALALCIALNLTVEETNNLISKLGYTLSNSLIFDLVIKFFIQNKIFDIYKINEELYSRNLPLLT